MLKKIFTIAALREAWLAVEKNRGSAGADLQELDDFALNLFPNLEQLRQEICSAIYRPQPLLRAWLPKKSGGLRPLAIPSVRDRVAQKAVALYLNPIFEAEFEECSYGYRKGRGTDRAVRRVIELRDAGFRWVVDADIHSFFEEIDHRLLLQEVGLLLPGPALLRLIELWLKTEIADGDTRIAVDKGVPQGSPLSPLLSNLYLDHLDETLLGENLRLVRFADDFLVLCSSENQAKEALELTEEVLDGLKLRMNSEKTKIVDFDRGFRFLGVHFVRSLVMKTAPAASGGKPQLTVNRPEKPVSIPPERLDTSYTAVSPDNGEPLLRTLYLLEHGTVLGKQSERFVIRRKGEIIKVVPAIKVDQILVFGMVQLTTQVMQFCLIKGIPIYLLSGHGRYYGVVDSFSTERVLLHREQFTTAASEQFSLRIARELMRGKINNSRLLLLRYARRRNVPELREAATFLKGTAGKLQGAGTLDQLRGFEGVAARHYFSALGSLLGERWKFTTRKRRPPPDPVNALLSYGYTLLLYNVYSLLLSKGLNPFVGYLHPLRAGHPALASDMMEEFRAPVVDAVVCNLLLNSTILPEDFTTTLDGHRRCQIHHAVCQRFIVKLEEKLNSPLTHPQTGMKLDYRRCIQQQLQELASAIMGRTAGYRPLVLR